MEKSKSHHYLGLVLASFIAIAIAGAFGYFFSLNFIVTSYWVVVLMNLILLLVLYAEFIRTKDYNFIILGLGFLFSVLAVVAKVLPISLFSEEVIFKLGRIGPLILNLMVMTMLWFVFIRVKSTLLGAISLFLSGLAILFSFIFFVSSDLMIAIIRWSNLLLSLVVIFLTGYIYFRFKQKGAFWFFIGLIILGAAGISSKYWVFAFMALNIIGVIVLALGAIRLKTEVPGKEATMFGKIETPFYARISTKISISLFGIVFLFIGSIGLFSLYQLRQLESVISKDIVQTIDQAKKADNLDELAQTIKYYDEVLTQSARNYAFTQNIKWAQRYKDNEPALDQAIKEAINKGDEKDKVFFSDVDQANLALIEMEYLALDYVANDKSEEAVAILESDEYWQQKEFYKAGLDKYANRRHSEYEEAQLASDEILNSTVEKVGQINKDNINLGLLFTTIMLVVLIIVEYFIVRQILSSISNLQEAARRISQGNLDQKIDVISKDEIGQLAKAFNKMVNDLKKSRSNIEQQVAERTADLEKLNKYMVGRELKMVELKKTIKELELGKSTAVVKDNWSDKFQAAINLEEDVIIELKNSYLKAVEESSLTKAKKQKAHKLVEILINESTEHRDKFKALIKQTNEQT